MKLKDVYPLYLNNKAVQPNTDLAVIDKFTGEVAFRTALATPDVIDEAIAGAIRAAEPMARPFTPSPAHTGADVVSTRAEGGLSSEAETLKEQARRSEPPDEKENLLSVKPGATPSP